MALSLVLHYFNSGEAAARAFFANPELRGSSTAPADAASTGPSEAV